VAGIGAGLGDFDVRVVLTVSREYLFRQCYRQRTAESQARIGCKAPVSVASTIPTETGALTRYFAAKRSATLSQFTVFHQASR
jgi:hypothetical protein